MIPIVIAPLPAGGEGRQSIALAGWGSSSLKSNQADMISLNTILRKNVEFLMQEEALTMRPAHSHCKILPNLIRYELTITCASSFTLASASRNSAT